MQRTQRPALVAAPQPALSEDASGEVLLIQDRGRTERVPLTEVMYFKAEQKYVTVRTTAGIPAGLAVLDGLPPLPSIGLTVYRAQAQPAPAVRQLEALLVDHVQSYDLVPEAAPSV